MTKPNDQDILKMFAELTELREQQERREQNILKMITELREQQELHQQDVLKIFAELRAEQEDLGNSIMWVEDQINDLERGR